MVNFADKSSMVIHSDQTKIYTSSDKLKYTIEHPGKIFFNL